MVDTLAPKLMVFSTQKMSRGGVGWILLSLLLAYRKINVKRNRLFCQMTKINNKKENSHTFILLKATRGQILAFSTTW